MCLQLNFPCCKSQNQSKVVSGKECINKILLNTDLQRITCERLPDRLNHRIVALVYICVILLQNNGFSGKN